MNKTTSFDEAAQWDREQHRSLSPQERQHAARILKERAYLGAEFERMSVRIAGVFGVDAGYCASLAFDEGALQAAREVGQRYTASTDLATGSDVTAADDAWDPVVFGSAAVASHALNDALVALQLGAVEVARGGTPIRTVFVDGGFSRNAIFLRLLARALDPVEVHVTELAQASAVGAALLVSGDIDRERVRELIEAKRVGR